MPKRKRRAGRPPKPILLPECNLEFARGIYTGEGTHYCEIKPKEKVARLVTEVRMTDYEALKKLEPCFGVPVGKYIDPKGARVIRRFGKKAVELAETLSVTIIRKQQIETARKNAKNTGKKAIETASPKKPFLQLSMVIPLLQIQLFQ